LKSLVSHRPSPALIVSILALVVAMAGTGYAALKLPKNSVGTRQLKRNAVTKAKIRKNAVTGAKVRKHTLTRRNINLAKLGTVPSAKTAGSAKSADSANTANTADKANTADTASVANGLSPLEAKHVVGSPGEPGFENGWQNYPGGEEGIGSLTFGPISFYKDHEGIVHLEGLAVTESESLTSVFTLPPGYRPASGTSLLLVGGEGFVAIGGTGATLEGKDIGGKVIAEGLVVLDGLTFRAEG